MSAIAYGLIRKQPPATENWLTVLNKHLERPEKQRTWQVFSRELRMLKYCNQINAVKFIEKLFVKYPKVRDSVHGVHLIAYLRNFIGEEAFTTFNDQIADSNWTMGIQAKGELYGCSYLAKDDFHSVNDFIDLVSTPEAEADNRLLTGVAFAVAKLWKEGRYQLQATELFEKLVERKCPNINQALDGVFLSDQFVPNRNSKRVLHAATKNPEVIQKVSVYHFAEMLELFVASEPGLVLKLSNILLDQLELNPEAEFPRNFDLSDPALTSIAITLQRTGGDFRSAGLDLFERLLRLGFSSTIQTMNELDNRPVNVVHRARRRRRRKSKPHV